MTGSPSRPLRCHLLVGPPASGKTTLAAVLAELTGAVVLSTDVVRAPSCSASRSSWEHVSPARSAKEPLPPLTRRSSHDGPWGPGSLW